MISKHLSLSVQLFGKSEAGRTIGLVSPLTHPLNRGGMCMVCRVGMLISNFPVGGRSVTASYLGIWGFRESTLVGGPLSIAG
jgi:hypothetical protein